jgi:hypothetical protein
LHIHDGLSLHGYPGFFLSGSFEQSRPTTEKSPYPWRHDILYHLPSYKECFG